MFSIFLFWGYWKIAPFLLNFPHCWMYIIISFILLYYFIVEEGTSVDDWSPSFYLQKIHLQSPSYEVKVLNHLEDIWPFILNIGRHWWHSWHQRARKSENMRKLCSADYMCKVWWAVFLHNVPLFVMVLKIQRF